MTNCDRAESFEIHYLSGALLRQIQNDQFLRTFVHIIVGFGTPLTLQ